MVAYGRAKMYELEYTVSNSAKKDICSITDENKGLVLMMSAQLSVSVLISVVLG